MGWDVVSYCRYHRWRRGHKSVNGKILKREIENLAQRGLLITVVAHPERSRSLPQRMTSSKMNNPGPSHNKRWTIDVIARDFTIGGVTNNAREVYITKYPQLYSWEKDVIPSAHHHLLFQWRYDSYNNAHIYGPVVTTEVIYFNLKKILVDGGNSISIMFLGTFEKLVASTFKWS